MKQSEIFMTGEGEAWLKRNVKKLDPKNDPILDMMRANKMLFESTLEIGCANGWRLWTMLDDGLTKEAMGIDPGSIDDLSEPHLLICKGHAADLAEFGKARFDCVIYGWCLYLCDPEDYFKIVYEGDRVLKDGGFLIIHDFNSMVPHKRPYKHKEGVYSHKMNFAKLWLCHPSYHVYRAQQSGEGDSECMTWILRKNMANAFPVRK